MPFQHPLQAFLQVAQRHPLRLLLPAWLLAQGLLYGHYGIKIAFDSHRYLAYTDSLLTGGDYWHEGSGKFYASYTFLLALVQQVAHYPVPWLVLLQVVVSAVAAVYLYKSTLLLSRNKLAPFLATLCFILWPDLQFWNLYVHTESLYISLSVFILYLLLVARQPGQYLCLVVLLVMACFLRPNGIFLTIAATAFLLLRCFSRYRIKRTPLSVLAMVCALFLLIITGAFFLEIFSPLGYYHAGQFIQGYKGHTSAVVLPPAALAAEPVALQLLGMISEQPLAFAKLLAGRFFFFWAQVRPYYSPLHNIVILLFFLPLYYFAATSIFSVKHRPFLAFVLTLAGLHTLMVTVIAVDWDNRFIVPLLPFIFTLAGTTVDRAGILFRSSKY